MCLAEFAAYYYKDYKSDVSETVDAQPEILTDDIPTPLHQNSNVSIFLPRKIRLMNGKEVMKCRKVKAVIRYLTRQRNLKNIFITFSCFTIHGDKTLRFLEMNKLSYQNSLNLKYKL